ncbi:uncharacterized protein JCM6883_000245 [Sporobolomyces salmoneus]|uniref:uncharacterized protein n=1 Tax=Sporobolomyces salmoneus TaxID=183962 RepID=UPI00316EBFC2
MRITISDRDPHHTRFKSAHWFKGAESMLAGAGAGLVTSVVTCPLDVIKTKLQAGGAVKEGKGRTSGLIGTFTQIWTHDGFRGLYRGLGPTIIGYLPTWAIYFFVYDQVKGRLSRIRGSDDAISHITAAMTAGASGTILTNPLWVVKTRFMTQRPNSSDPRYRHTGDALVRIYREEGPKAFYRGMLPSLFGVAHVAVQFPLYEQFKTFYRPPDGSDIPSSTILFCSSVSKMIASVATYPHEVLRTRLQIQKNHLQSQSQSSKSHLEPALFEGLLPTFRRILGEEGVKGFYRGMGVNLLRTVPSSAVTLLVYEKIMQTLLRRTHPEDYDEEGRKVK